ncbi:MAG TPA: hypothetical protein VF115_13610 [Acidimicrobiia bacterium]
MSTTRTMTELHAGYDLRGERLAGLGGVAFGVILLLWLFQLLNSVPADDGSTQEWLAFMTEDPGVWVAYALLVGIGLMAFLWCLASLRSILARAEGGAGRLSTLVFGAGILMVGLLAVSLALIGATPIAAEFLAAFEADPHMGLLLIGAAGIVFPYAAMAGGVVAAAASVLILRTNTFPRWFGWVSLVSGVAIFAAAIVDFTFLLLPVWTIVAGVLILTRAETDAGLPT